MNEKLPQVPEVTTGLPRRRFMNTAALAGLGLGLAACNQKTEGAATAQDGEVWTARAYDEQRSFAAGKQVQVVEIRGATALVAD